jgi:hypothetical protein
MRRMIWMLALVGVVPAFSQSLDGRWDLTVKMSGDTYPSWLEVAGDKVRVVGRVASVHPANGVEWKGSELQFKTSEWLGKQVDVTWTVKAAGAKLTGTQKRADGVEGTITGVRAPALDRPEPAKWSKPVALFDGVDMNGWEALATEPGKPVESHWKVVGGEMVNESPGANIRTKRTFTDFRLHVEYNCPDEGNSGVYLRGRDEIQIAYQKENDAFHGMGALYGFIAPAADVAAKPGEWETLDVTLVGRKVTVVRDGVTTIDNKEIPGITGGALDSQEGAPGPIYIQGDHTGGMKYRNITIAVAER